MGDGYPARFPRRLRAVFVGAAVLASMPVVILDPVAGVPVVGWSLAVALIAVQAAAVWWLGARPLLGTAVVLVAEPLPPPPSAAEAYTELLRLTAAADHHRK